MRIRRDRLPAEERARGAAGNRWKAWLVAFMQVDEARMHKFMAKAVELEAGLPPDVLVAAAVEAGHPALLAVDAASSTLAEDLLTAHRPRGRAS